MTLFPSLTAGTGQRPISPLAADIGAALLVTFLVFLVYAASGFPTLTDANGDNDSLLRLVEVRDLLAGQGWFDLHQYRMGPPGGFVMHWSRLVDAPIASMLLTARAFGASPEIAAIVAGLAWPLTLHAVGLFLILRMVRIFAGGRAMLPAAVIGGAALYATGVFLPGNLDHHNIQLVLVLAMLMFMVREEQGFGSGLAAGICAAVMLGIGMETLPFVAAGGVIVALRLALLGTDETRPAAGFGAGLAAAAAAVMALTVRPSEWLLVHCDAFSMAQFAAATVSGCGLALIAIAPIANRNLPRRLSSLSLLAILMASVAVFLFPQCIGSPYAALDPELRRLWLDGVGEAQPLTRILASDPTLAFASYVTPLLALGLAITAIVRGRTSRGWLALTGLLLIAVLVSFWQVRGAKFALPLASIVLSGWVARRRAVASESGGRMEELKTVAAWVFSISIFWSFSAAVVATAYEKAGIGEPTPEPTAQSACYSGEDYAALAELPVGNVLAPSNLGAAILRFTPHRAFAGPYHRNQTGMLIALNAFTAPPQEARSVVAANGADYIAICPGNDESGFLASHAPQGLMAVLLEGRVPDWMQPLADDPSAPLRIYRVTTP